MFDSRCAEKEQGHCNITDGSKATVDATHPTTAGAGHDMGIGAGQSEGVVDEMLPAVWARWEEKKVLKRGEVVA